MHCYHHRLSSASSPSKDLVAPRPRPPRPVWDADERGKKDAVSRIRCGASELQEEGVPDVVLVATMQRRRDRRASARDGRDAVRFGETLVVRADPTVLRPSLRLALVASSKERAEPPTLSPRFLPVHLGPSRVSDELLLGREAATTLPANVLNRSSSHKTSWIRFGGPSRFAVLGDLKRDEGVVLLDLLQQRVHSSPREARNAHRYHDSRRDHCLVRRRRLSSPDVRHETICLVVPYEEGSGCQVTVRLFDGVIQHVVVDFTIDWMLEFPPVRGFASQRRRVFEATWPLRTKEALVFEETSEIFYKFVTNGPEFDSETSPRSNSRSREEV